MFFFLAMGSSPFNTAGIDANAVAARPVFSAARRLNSDKLIFSPDHFFKATDFTLTLLSRAMVALRAARRPTTTKAAFRTVGHGKA
jgi:hypothetical protein